jgi:hypothetical protein
MKRLKIGDIIEIKTEKGLVYAQYTHNNKLMGTLIRVFQKFYPDRPRSFNEIVNGDIRFVTFFPLKEAVKRNIVEIIDNCNIPDKAKKFPIFKNGVINSLTGKVDTWWLWDGEKDWKVGKLNSEQQSYPIQEIWNDTLLIERIVSEWRQEND